MVMPGTTLSKDGLIPTERSTEHVEAGAVLLNQVLHESLAAELIGKLETAQRENKGMHFSSCAMNDAMILSLTEGSLRKHIEDADKADTTFAEMMSSAQRMRSVYERNFSPFALDLVGAVIRQGVFVEKMQYFDW
ncbi:MAG: hypothetical protein M1823_007243, partial [Watsoniomyces obsoletus]